MVKMAIAGSYTVSNTELNLGTVSFPSTFSGTLLSTYSVNDSYYDVITFTAGSGGSYTVSNSPTKQFGDTHTIKTVIYRGGSWASGTEIAQFSGASSAKVTFSAGSLYTIRCYMLSPSYYTTTKYSYSISIGSPTPTPTTKPDLSSYTPSGWASSMVLSTSSTSRSNTYTSFYNTDNIYLSWAFHCTGKAISSKFYTYLYVDGVKKHEWYTDGLEAEHHTSVTGYNLGKLSAGSHTIKVVTDGTGVVAESNESNNTITRTITVRSDCDEQTVYIRFYPGGGSGSMSTVSKRISSCSSVSYTLPSCQYTRSGYTFAGWSVDNACEASYSNPVRQPGYVIYDLCGDVTLTATWTYTPQRPSNDNFANATRISGTSGSVNGSTVGATRQSGEPLPLWKSAATNTIWWVWTAPSSGRATFSTANTTFDTVMGVYTGSYLSSLSTVAQDDDGGANRTSVCAFDASAGTTYYIAVSGYGSSQGSIRLGWSIANATYTVTFYGGGETLGRATMETGKNTNQAAASVYKPTRAGYVLSGWYDANDNIMFDAQGRAVNGKYWNGAYVKGTSSATWKFAGNVTAYAHWTPAPVQKYSVTFYGGGKTLGSATMETGKNTNQAAASLYKPTREGYTLSGWYDANDNIMFDAQGRAVNGKYWNGAYVKGTSSATWKFAGNVTAYAHWTPAPTQLYTLTLNANDGSVSGQPSVSVQVVYGKNTNQAAANRTVTRAGYVLVGWYDIAGNAIFDKNGYAVNGMYWNGSYSPGVSSATWKYAGNVMAYALWTQAPAPATYTVTLNANGGSVSGQTSVSVQVEYGKNTNQAAANRSVTHSGCMLAGWYDYDGNIVFTAQGYAANGMYWNGSYSPGVSSATWKYAGNITAYALWVPKAGANAAVKCRRAVDASLPSGELFAPGELTGTFADGEGTFALTLDEGLETAYLVTWTDDGGVACECEAAVVGDMLVLTTEDDEVYNFVWEDDGLVATRVE